MQMMLQKGDPLHIQGFILNKLYMDGCWVQPGRNPKKHYSKSDIPKGYLKHFRGRFNSELKALKKKRLIMEFPHSGDGENHYCAIKDDTLIDIGLPICNDYRISVGLLPLGEDFIEIIC